MADVEWDQVSNATVPIKVEAALIAANTFSNTIVVRPDRHFNISVSGTFVGTVTLQRQYEQTGTFHDFLAETEPFEAEPFHFEHDIAWRIGFKAGDFTSGTANVRISQ